MKSKNLHAWNRLAGAALLALAATLPAPHATGGAALDMDNAAAIYGIALDKDGNYYSGAYGLELWVLSGTTVPASINSATNVTAYGDLAADGFTLAQTWSGQTMSDGTFELGGVALPMVQPPGSEAVLALAAWTGGAANWAAAVAAGAQGGVIAFANATVNGSLLPPPAPPSLEQGWNAYGQDLVMTPTGSLPNTPPALTWNKPASIIYGTALSSVQLNATANVPGSKVYSPPAGTVLPAGTNILSLVFSAAGYSSVTTNVSLVVLPAPLTVAANDATRLCGAANPAFTDTLSGLVNGDNITAANTCSATTASPAGTYAIIPGLIDPSHRAANYTVSLVNGTLTVLSAGPPSGEAALDMDNAAARYGIALDKAGSYYSGAYGLELWVLNGTTVPASINSAANITAYGDLAADGFTLAQTWSGQTMSDGTFELGGVALPMVQPPGSEAVLALAAWTGGAANWAAAVAAGAQGGVIAFANATVNGSLLPPPTPPDLEQGWNAYGQDLVMTPTGSVPNTPPALTWNKPASIIYGTALSSVQLNATANVPGSKVYSPPAGTVLPAGTNILSLVFSAAGHSSVTTNVSLVVLPAPLTVAANNATRLSGAANPAFTDTIAGLVNGDNITAANTCSATTASPAGTYPIIPGLIDLNHRAGNYTVSLVNGTLTVLPAPPPSSEAALEMDNAAAIYGLALDKDGNYYSGAYGLELWVLNGTTVPASINSATNVTAYGDLAADGFTLAQTWSGQTMSDGTFELGGVALPMVQPPGSEAVLALAAWTGGAANWAAAVAAGAQGGVIAFANATVNGSLLPPPVPPDLEQGWNAYGQDLVMTPTVSLPNTPPALTWNQPASIIYGTALSSVQLNATANVPGSKVYSPPAGTVLPAGTNILSLVFSAAGYSSVATNVSLVVLPAPLTVTAGAQSKTYGQALNLGTTAFTTGGLVNGDTVASVTLSSAGAGATAPVALSPYSITPSAAIGTGLGNYNIAYQPGPLTVLPATPTVTWTNPAPITYGTALGTNQLNAAVSAPGTEVYSPPAGTVLPTGTNVLSLVLTPADPTDYNSLTTRVSLAVLPAPLTVAANNASRPYGQANPVFSGTIIGLQNGDNIAATYSCSATSASAPGSYFIVPTLASPSGLQTNYQVTLVDGTLIVLPVIGPPVLAALPDQTVYAGSLLSFRTSATDTDQPPRTLSFSLGPGAPAGASIGRGTGPSPVSGLFTWTPTAAQAPSTNRITVIVTDNGVPPLSASASFTVVVKPGATPPVLGDLADRTVYAGSLLSFRASATETDQPPRTLTFSLGPGAPAGASIGRGTGPSPVSGLFTWMPTAAQAPSTNRITVIVSDNGVPPLSASASFTVVVKPGATPPVLGDLADRTVYAGSLLSFRASATETDQPPRTLTFSLGPGAPAGASIGRGTGPSPVSGLFTWTPTAAQAPSTNPITVIVSDNGVPPLSASNSFTVVVLVPKPGFGVAHQRGSLPIGNQRAEVAHDPQTRILSVSESNAGQCTIRFSGVNGQAYELQASGDLETWRAVASGVFPSTEIEVVDTLGAQPGCFYRLRLPNTRP